MNNCPSCNGAVGIRWKKLKYKNLSSMAPRGASQAFGSAFLTLLHSYIYVSISKLCAANKILSWIEYIAAIGKRYTYVDNVFSSVSKILKILLCNVKVLYLG